MIWVLEDKDIHPTSLSYFGPQEWNYVRHVDVEIVTHSGWVPDRRLRTLIGGLRRYNYQASADRFLSLLGMDFLFLEP